MRSGTVLFARDQTNGVQALRLGMGIRVEGICGDCPSDGVLRSGPLRIRYVVIRIATIGQEKVERRSQ
jgi:hypothetical protein